MAHVSVPTPIGPLLIATTDIGVVRIAFPSEDPDTVLTELHRHSRPDSDAGAGSSSRSILDATAWQLDEYFDGDRREFDLPIDDRLVDGFTRDVLASLSRIPYGRTASYGEVAAMIGRPRAARAVGTACRANRLAILRPCHRVIRADGTLGGFGGNESLKRKLLDLERGPGGYVRGR